MISRWVLGVVPLKPGFDEILVRPHPGPLKRLSGVVPTPRGPVRLEMTRESGRWCVSLETPASATLDFAGRRQRFAAGHHAITLPLMQP